ncbi:MAG: hypothetical protein ABIT76_07745 [Chthoniobacterales bacterium]
MSFFRVGLILGLALQSSYSQLTPPQPPRETPLAEIAPDKVPQEGISEKGQVALAILPEKWKVAETPNFYIHFRRMTEARKVGREVEFNLAFIAAQLGTTPAQYARKSHVYVFEDAGEWASFVAKTQMPEWTSSFAYGDELFLNVRGQNGGSFDSQTLAHETTHAVVARIYRERRWPLWLNEGVAEYMGSAAVAGRKNQTLKRLQNRLEVADMPLEELIHLEAYPQNTKDVSRLYQTSERFVRFLMSKGTSQQFVGFADALIAGQTVEQAIAANYHQTFPDFKKFQADYEKYSGGKR